MEQPEDMASLSEFDSLAGSIPPPRWRSPCPAGELPAVRVPLPRPLEPEPRLPPRAPFQSVLAPLPVGQEPMPTRVAKANEARLRVLFGKLARRADVARDKKTQGVGISGARGGEGGSERTRQGLHAVYF